MSVQENKLKAIADAIREKDGTTAPIPANDFPARIRAIPSGGGGSGGIDILEGYDPDFVEYVGYIQLPEYTAVLCEVGCEILED